MAEQLFCKTLGHQLNQARLWQAWQQNTLSNAWLFAGPEGVGKKRVALGLAQGILCEQAREPSASSPGECGQCGECVRVAAGTSDALMLLSNPHIIKTHEARQLVDFFNYRAQKKIQMAIIDNAHRMHPTAANILLKTLEELPPRALVILISSSPFSLLPTVRSRVQSLWFQSLSEPDLAQLTGAQGWLLKAARGRASEVARLKECSELREQVFSVWADALQNLKIEPLMARLKELAQSSEVCLQSVQFFLQLLRDARMWSLDRNKILHTDHVALIEQSARLGPLKLDRILEGCMQVEKAVLSNFDRSLSLEMWLRRTLLTN